MNLLYYHVADAWVLLPSGPHLSVYVVIDFLIVFIDLNACFKNSYLKLGVSKWGEPNFVGFIMECSM